MHEDGDTLLRLGQVYTQLNAPVGQLGLDTLKISTAALASKSAGDSTYNSLESKLMSYGQQRDSLTAQMSALLNGAEFGHQAINREKAQELIEQGESLLNKVHEAAE
jgi:hypothetical protein